MNIRKTKARYEKAMDKKYGKYKWRTFYDAKKIMSRALEWEQIYGRNRSN